jgi:hypothetical protein
VENEEKKSAAAKPPEPPPPPPGAKPPGEPVPGSNEDAAKEGWASRAFVGGLRALLPLVDEYARTKHPNDDFERGSAGSLSNDERKAYSEAAARLVYEGAAALRANSPQNKPETVDRDPKTGRYPPLTVADGVLAVRALQSLLKTESKPKVEAAPASEVAVVASLVEVVSPRSPREIRSVAMQQRKAVQALNAGGSARAYAARNQAYAVGAGPRVLGGASAPARASKGQAAVVYRAPKGGCGCGGPSASSLRPAVRALGCPDCGQPTPEPLATRNAEGKCEPNPLQISCDTQVKLKQCVKSVLCDTLWCLEAAICKNGQPSFKGVTGQTFIDCLGTALCSLIRCVPEVLCPPQTECGPLLPRADIECNYAVEELP